MTWETVNQLRTAGVLLVLAAALVLLLINMVIMRAVPRLVLPLMVLVWTAGVVGFVLVLIVDHPLINVVLAVLFVVTIGFHGWRIVQRSRQTAEPQAEDDSEEP